MIPLKLKRKLRYKGHYKYDYIIRPDKVMIALRWLKQNNPLFSNIDINDNWVTDQLISNSELVRPDNDTNDITLLNDLQNSTP